MNFTIKEIRKALTGIYQWLSINEDRTFFKDEANKSNSPSGIKLSADLDEMSRKARLLLNTLSESLEDLELCAKNLRLSIEREKEIRKRHFFNNRGKKLEKWEEL